VVLISGSARAHIEGTWHYFGAGQVCLMRPNQRETVHYTPDKTTYQSWCAVDAESLAHLDTFDGVR
jgi:hypothetical protein